MIKTQRTYMPKCDPALRKCYLIDAKDKVLGRVASQAAKILRGKHKTTFTPHMDMGDNVVIINADKIRVTGKKFYQKIYETYSGYPSGQKVLTFQQQFQKSPIRVIRLAVDRMISKGALGNQIRTRLRVYTGDQHPHQAQKPIALEI
jgi:large subunit ribosomal protein L13